ncbi:MAG TPA: protein kinase [Vicinamibacterales bacterium]|nr:protein kinase [Vicinamibacterales bacterium]
MRVAPGSRLGPYAIESPLGAGGMGEVYRARDVRLDRSVAVKVLADSVAHDPQFRERFQREARAISALSHPHICTVFDVGQEGDVAYLVMELLEGETLAARLSRGALPQSQGLSIAIQIGTALAAAHRVGIVHRDLKPGNIMISPMRAGGTGAPHAKLLDFGLARSASRESASVTTQVALTAVGEAVGTIPYMSPEHLEGRAPDARSDIWSFGCVLYEMFAGHRAFAGDSDARLISEILTSEPAPVAPASLDRLIRKCLAKDPEHRWQTSADLTDELQWIDRQQTVGDHGSTTPTVATGRPRRGRAAIVVAGAVVLAALAFGAGYRLRPPPPQIPVTSFELQPPPGAEWGDGLALSPDGRHLAFLAIPAGTWRARIWIQDLAGGDARQLAGTDGASIGLFWSPDGASIGFFAHGQLKTVRVETGNVLTLAPAPSPGGGTWNRDGVIVYSPDLYGPSPGLWRVSASAGRPVSLTTPKSGETHRGPLFLPDGRHLLYIGDTGVRATSLDDPSQQTQVLNDRTSVQFVAPGYLLFVRAGSLWAQRFDPDTLRLSGEPVMTMGRIEQTATRRYSYIFSASDAGILSYRSVVQSPVRQFVWVDRQGRELTRLGSTGAWQGPVLSPDEKQVAFWTDQSGNTDIHVMDVASGTDRRLTFSEEPDDYPVWSRDSRRVAFRRRSGMFEVPADGRGPEKLLLAKDSKTDTLYPRDYGPLERELIYLSFPRGLPTPNGGIYVLPLVSDQLPRKWLDTPANEVFPRLSPDGRWMAYGTQEGPEQAGYVQRYPELGARAQVSDDGFVVTGLQWRGDGREMLYISPSSVLMAVPMKDGARAGPGVRLFNLAPSPYDGFAITKDGQRLLVNRPATGSDKKTITVVTNWLAKAMK